MEAQDNNNTTSSSTSTTSSPKRYVSKRRPKTPTTQQMWEQINEAFDQVASRLYRVELRGESADLVLMAIIREKFGMTDDDIRAMITEHTKKMTNQRAENTTQATESSTTGETVL